MLLIKDGNATDRIPRRTVRHRRMVVLMNDRERPAFQQFFVQHTHGFPAFLFGHTCHIVGQGLFEVNLLQATREGDNPLLGKVIPHIHATLFQKEMQLALIAVDSHALLFQFTLMFTLFHIHVTLSSYIARRNNIECQLMSIIKHRGNTRLYILVDAEVCI